MARSHAMFESLESRTLMSADTLTQDQMNLANAVTKLHADQLSTATTLLADHAKVKADGKSGDANLAMLRYTLAQAQLARDNTMLMDYTTLKLAANTDKIAILKDRASIHMDKASKDLAQLALDKTQLGKDQLKLAMDRDTYGTDLENDRISTKATVIADKQAIATSILMYGSNPQLAMDKQQLINDELSATTTLANDRKTIFADELIVSQDKHG